MKETERQEINNLPEKYRPLGAWAYFGYTLLFSIPLVGFILLIIFSFNGNNINRRSFARSYFCAYILIVAVMLILIFAFQINIFLILSNFTK